MNSDFWELERPYCCFYTEDYELSKKLISWQGIKEFGVYSKPDHSIKGKGVMKIFAWQFKVPKNKIAKTCKLAGIDSPKIKKKKLSEKQLVALSIGRSKSPIYSSKNEENSKEKFTEF